MTRTFTLFFAAALLLSTGSNAQTADSAIKTGSWSHSSTVTCSGNTCTYTNLHRTVTVAERDCSTSKRLEDDGWVAAGTRNGFSARTGLHFTVSIYEHASDSTVKLEQKRDMVEKTAIHCEESILTGFK